jgi:hypothetical protein
MESRAEFTISGQVLGAESQRGIPGLTVEAMDRDLIFDDRLGTVTTNEDGRFEIRYTEADFRDFIEQRPDIYIRILAADGALLYTSEHATRCEAGKTETFNIELPETAERIGNSEELRRRIVSDPELQEQLASAVAEQMAAKNLLPSDLTYTFVPIVAAHPAAISDLFVNGLGPQPEPPFARPRGAFPAHDPTPEPARSQVRSRITPDEYATAVFWPWWEGTPPIELLLRLDRLRITDLVADDPVPIIGNATEFAYRIMADRDLVQGLARSIGAVLSRHGVVAAADKAISFVPVVYSVPHYATDALAVQAIVPQVFDHSGQVAPPHWVNPIDGVPAPEVLQAAGTFR